MSHELAIRIPSEVGAWVRRQPGSSSEVAYALARAAWQRRQDIALRDPGPGDDRLKFRLEPRVLQFVRGATHSRDATAALRKLLRWGYEGGALPASQPIHSLPQAHIVDTQLLPAHSTAMVLSTPRPVISVQFQGALHPDKYEEYRRSQAAAAQAGHLGPRTASEPQDASLGVQDTPIGLLARCLAKLPESWLPWLPVVAVLGALWVLRRIAAVAALSAPIGEPALPVGGTAVVVPKITGWTPQVASGLGALFSLVSSHLQKHSPSSPEVSQVIGDHARPQSHFVGSEPVAAQQCRLRAQRWQLCTAPSGAIRLVV